MPDTIPEAPDLRAVQGSQPAPLPADRAALVERIKALATEYAERNHGTIFGRLDSLTWCQLTEALDQLAAVPAAAPTHPLRVTGVETPLSSIDRLNLLGRWFENRSMDSMARICRTAAAELKAIADRRDEAVAKIVSSGPANMPLLQWLSADHSFRAPIGSRLYAAPPSQPKCLEDLMTKIQAFGLACYQHESGAEQIAMQDEIRRDLAALAGDFPSPATVAAAERRQP